MISMTSKSTFNRFAVMKKVRAANIKSLRHAGAAIRLIATRSIKRSKKPSAPGTPPHTRKGQLKKAILYAANDESVVIGPDIALFGTAGMAHEFGGRYRDERYPKRPLMGPALEKVKDRLPRLWRGSVR